MADPISRFYTGTNDSDLAKDVISKRPDVYIQRYEYIGEGVLDVSTPASATLTPATSPAWAVDAYNSTVARNLLIVDNNGKVATAKIADTTATAITFDSTDCKLEEDGGTTATLSAGTKQFVILTPSSVSGQVYGPFMGYAEGLELSITQTRKSFKYGMPPKVVFSDIAEVTGTISGGTINFTNEDVMQAVLNASEYGRNTSGEISYAIGTGAECNAQGNYYRMTFVGQDRNCRTVYIIARKLQFALDGNILSESNDGYMLANFSAELLADTLYPDDANLVGVNRGA
jgi:hypothetical protein